MLNEREIVTAMQEGLRAYGRGELRNGKGGVEVFERNGEKRLHIVNEAEDPVHALRVVKTIDETWKGAQKTGRTTSVTLYQNNQPILSDETDNITNARTGAAAALAAYWLAPRVEHQRVAVIGTGAVAQSAIQGLAELMNPEEIHFGTSSEERAKAFQADAAKLVPRAKLVGHVLYAGSGFSEDARPLFEGTTVLVIANALKYPLPASLVDLMHPHAHISAMSGDGHQNNIELDVLVRKDVHYAFDVVDRSRRSSEVRLLSPEAFSGINSIGTIGDLARNAGEKYRDVFTIYDSSGMGVSDLILARAIAVKEGKLHID